MNSFKYLVCLIGLSVMALPALAGGAGLHVSDAWARETPPTAKSGAAYMTFSNQGSKARRIVGASSDVARKVEIHETLTENGMMKMRAIEELNIAPGEQTALMPGGAHIMFMGLSGPFVSGDTVTVLFELNDGSTFEVTAPVRKMEDHMSKDVSKDMQSDDAKKHNH